MAGYEWHWTAELQETRDDDVLQLLLRVKDVANTETIHQLTAYINISK